MASYKIKCGRCKENYILIKSGRRRSGYKVCYECDKSSMEGNIEDPELEKLLDIPEEFYKNNSFLRDIKKKCVRFQNLSEKQIAAFKKAVDKMKESREEIAQKQ